MPAGLYQSVLPRHNSRGFAMRFLIVDESSEFRRALKAAPPSGAAHEVEIETITVRERMLAVMERLEGRESLEFEAVLVDEGGRPATRALIVATFLAVLELTRLEALRLFQSTNEAGVPRGPIHLRRGEGLGGGDWRLRIAEVM